MNLTLACIMLTGLIRSGTVTARQFLVTLVDVRYLIVRGLPIMLATEQPKQNYKRILRITEAREC